MNEKLFEDFANAFRSDTLFIHDCIKQIMQTHKLDYRDKNLQSAFMQLAIGVKNKEYPSVADANDTLCRTCGEPLEHKASYSNCDECIDNYKE